MKTRLLILTVTAILLILGNVAYTQTTGLSVSLTKSNGKIYAITETGKHSLNFEISGIENAKHAENLMKYIRGYRGVEEFNLTPIAGTNKWKGEGTFYEYSEAIYFKNLFKLMKVSEVVQDNVVTPIDNL